MLVAGEGSPSTAKKILYPAPPPPAPPAPRVAVPAGTRIATPAPDLRNQLFAAIAPPPAPAPGGGPSQIGPPSQAPPGQSYDLSSDPEYAAAVAQSARDTSLAEGQALDARRQLLIALGDPALAAQVLGSSDPTLGSISDAATSTSQLGQIEAAFERGVRSSDLADNRKHLFYSSSRANHLGDLNQSLANQRTGAIGSASSQLSAILAALTAAKNAAADKKSAAAIAAQQRHAGSVIPA